MIKESNNPDIEKHRKIRVQLDFIQGNIETIEDLNREIQELTEEDQLEQEILGAAEYSADLAERISAVKAFMKDLIPEAQDDRSPTRSATHSSSHSSERNRFTKLPKLKLPSFAGNILDWSAFWDSFEAEVHADSSMSNVSKFTTCELNCREAPYRLY